MSTFLDRLFGRPEPAPRSYKAVVDSAPWQNAIPLSTLQNTPQAKAAAYLKAYKVGWFYKAGGKIADDIASLDWSVSDGDSEEGEEETTLDRPKLSIPFDSLSPIEQFMRLLERPNPKQTGRQLLRKTQVRLDFAGAAALYLEGGSSDRSLPTALYGISPARMWPSYDKAGQLIGWVMDKDAPGGGVPFDTSEILWMSTGNADNDDIWGTSVVEAVYAQVPLTDLMARHTADVLTTGGRLAGMMWPKERALDESEYTDAQRAWRNAVSDPNAARRMLIFPEPMEYASGASTPAEIGIPELALLNRDEILTAFPVSPYRLGVPMPGGLNSGEVRREDRRDYWEETIHPRADLLEEAIQVGLLSRYEAVMGQTFDFEIAEPNMDDAPSLLEKAGAFRALIGIGFDPEETVKAVGLDHIKWGGLPTLLDPEHQAEVEAAQLTSTVQDDTPRNNTNTQQEVVSKPKPKPKTPAPAKAVKARDDTAAKGMPTLQRFFDEQRTRVTDRIRASVPTAKAERKAWAAKSDPEWWDAAGEDAKLQGALQVIYRESGRQGLQIVADALGRIVPAKTEARVVEDLLRYGGDRIRDINARTLQSLVIELAEGTRRGYSISQLIDGVPAEGYKGIANGVLENGLPVFGDARAEMLARTETALSYNRSSLLGYKEYQIKYVQAIDGDEHEPCQSRNGREYEVDEALGMADHPNGTLDWVPVTGKSWDMPTDHTSEFLDAIKTITERPQPDIHVHTTPPDVVLPTPVVNVAAQDIRPFVNAIDSLSSEVKALRDTPPVVNVPAPVVNVPAPIVSVKAPPVTDVRVTAMPDRAHRLSRDKQGKPTGSVETDA